MLNNRDLVDEENREINIRDLYKKIDTEVEKFYELNYDQYINNGKFPVDLTSKTKQLDYAVAIPLLNGLKSDWMPVQLYSILCTLGAEIGLKHPMPVFDFVTLLEGGSILFSKYADIYINNKEALFKCLQRLSQDE